jgi:hypothetical protein
VLSAIISPQQLTPPLPFVFISEPPAEPPASQVSPQRSIVVSAQEIRHTRPAIITTAYTEITEGLPPEPTVVGALQPAVVQPYKFVAGQPAEPPPNSITRWPVAVIVGAQHPPTPLPFVGVSAPRAEPPSAAPQVLAKPVIVSAIQPPPANWRMAGATSPLGDQTPPVETPQVPVKPTIVTAIQPPPANNRGAGALLPIGDQQPVPPQPVNWWPRPVVQRSIEPPPVTDFAAVAWTTIPGATPTKSIVVPPQQHPIPKPYVKTKFFEWGPPPPVLRAIMPSVTTDMSLPFRPNGWVRVAHGFAEALPLLYQGTVVGGTMEGALVSGGVRTGSAVGGTVQNGYVTGGRR